MVSGDQAVTMPAEVTDFAHAHVGPLASHRFCGWNHGVSDVWDCTTSDGRRVIVKSCRDKYGQEVHAYRTWAPRLGERCPQLLAADDSLRTVIVTAVDGTLVQDTPLHAAAEAEVYRQAGQVLADLHGLDVDADESDPIAAFLERAERWNRRAADTVDVDGRAWMLARVAEIEPVLSGVRRAPCHRDFSPRNWMLDTDATVRVIDFGHTRVDYWILDVDRLWSDQWVDRPDLEAAFWDGYGVRATEDEWRVLEAVSALGAISTIAWSREHGDEAFEAHGRAHLARLRLHHE